MGGQHFMPRAYGVPSFERGRPGLSRGICLLGLHCVDMPLIPSSVPPLVYIGLLLESSVEEHGALLCGRTHSRLEGRRRLAFFPFRRPPTNP